MFFDIVDGVFDGLDLLGILIRDLDVKGLFKLHDELDDVEGVGPEIFLEAGAGSDFGFIHLKLLDDNLFYFFIYCGHLFLLFTSAIKIWMPVHETNTAMLKNTERLGECKANRALGVMGDQSEIHLFIIVLATGSGEKRGNPIAILKGDEVGRGRIQLTYLAQGTVDGASANSELLNRGLYSIDL